MLRKRGGSRREILEAKLEMTPMIDVVFQLLIFFIVIIKPEDILSHLDIIRPAPDQVVVENKVKDLLEILVFDQGYVLQQRPISLRRLERKLAEISRFSQNMTVIIKCTGSSPHQYLVELLDVCEKVGLRNLSVFSM